MKKYLLSCLVVLLSLAAWADDCVTNRLAAEAIGVENLKVGRTDDNFVVDMDLRLDSLELPADVRLIFTPVVGNGTEERRMPQLVINGRKQQIMYERHGYKDFAPGTQVVRRKNGTAQSLHYSAVLPYESWMQNSDFDVIEDLCSCGDSLGNRIPLRRMRRPVMAYIRPDVELKPRSVEGQAFIDYPLDRIELYPEYRNNPRELQKILETIELVKRDTNVTITGVSIHGYASPEGTYEHNTYLAENRAKTLKDYVVRQVALDESLFRVESTPEDWDGLKRFLSESNIEHKAELQAIVEDESLTYDERDHKMRDTYPSTYRYMLDNWYPALRHSDYVVNYSVRPFSVDEAKALLHSKPQQLSLREMFFVAQTYEPGSDAFNEAFEIAVRMYPDDPVANYNAASARLEREDYDGAAAYLQKAGNLPYAEHARGIIAVHEGRMDEARQHFLNAQKGGVPEATQNLQLLGLDK